MLRVYQDETVNKTRILMKNIDRVEYTEIIGAE